MKQFRKEQLELIANAIKRYNPKGKKSVFHNARQLEVVAWTIDGIANEVADKLQENTPDFDRQRFLEACGLEVKEETYNGFCGVAGCMNEPIGALEIDGLEHLVCDEHATAKK